jgi:hypothetical protein
MWKEDKQIQERAGEAPYWATLPWAETSLWLLIVAAILSLFQ